MPSIPLLPWMILTNTFSILYPIEITLLELEEDLVNTRKPTVLHQTQTFLAVTVCGEAYARLIIVAARMEGLSSAVAITNSITPNLNQSEIQHAPSKKLVKSRNKPSLTGLDLLNKLVG
mmetsp:Transcript_14453/g.40243  ORF Transcript_14453/g.40243 Transcript_14453/m.40243 type:complete len:119 (+) Transcript_14453:2707-3063(+)